MYIGYYDRDGAGVVRYRVRRSRRAYVLAAALLILAAAVVCAVLMMPKKENKANGAAPPVSGETCADTSPESRQETSAEAGEESAAPAEFAGLPVEAEVGYTDISCDPGALTSGQPLVLIIHTHTSEAYAEADGGRTADPALNVTALGTEFAKVLAENGVCAIHCSVALDEPTLLGSFRRAAELIRQYKQDYPTLLYVVDLHRLPDAIPAGGGRMRACASLSDLCPDSLPVAVEFTKKAGSADPEQMLPVYASDPVLNHDLCAKLGMHPLTLEIGRVTDGVASAKRYAGVSAAVFAEMVKGSVLSEAEPLDKGDGNKDQ